MIILLLVENRGDFLYLLCEWGLTDLQKYCIQNVTLIEVSAEKKKKLYLIIEIIINYHTVTVSR